MEHEASRGSTPDVGEVQQEDLQPISGAGTGSQDFGDGADSGGSAEEAEQRVGELRDEFLSTLQRSADEAHSLGGAADGAAAATTAPGSDEAAGQLQAIDDIEEDEEDFEDVEDFLESAGLGQGAEGAAADSAAARPAAQAAPSSSGASAAFEGPSTSGASLQGHPLEGLDDDPDAIDAAIEAMLAKHEEAAASGSGEGRGGGAASLLTNLLSRVQGGLQSGLQGGLEVGRQLVGQHVKIGERAGTSAQERAKMRQQRYQAPAKEKKMSMRWVPLRWRAGCFMEGDMQQSCCMSKHQLPCGASWPCCWVALCPAACLLRMLRQCESASDWACRALALCTLAGPQHP